MRLRPEKMPPPEPPGEMERGEEVMTDAEIMALYEQGLSLEHIAAQIVVREANAEATPKKKQAIERAQYVICEALVERRRRHAGQEP